MLQNHAKPLHLGLCVQLHKAKNTYYRIIVMLVLMHNGRIYHAKNYYCHLYNTHPISPSTAAIMCSCYYSPPISGEQNPKHHETNEKENSRLCPLSML